MCMLMVSVGRLMDGKKVIFIRFWDRKKEKGEKRIVVRGHPFRFVS